MKVYRPVFFLAIFLIYAHCGLGQPLTKNDYTGSWESANSWFNGIQPDPLTASIDDPMDIYGYITRIGSLHFANIGNNSLFITIHDTLVVQGDMTFENNSINLKVATGGLLVVFGNFTSNNKVTLDNGGTVVVTGDVVLNGGQNDYTDNGGALYVDGNISGNGDTADADAIDQPSSNLATSQNNDEIALYTFINGGGDTPLPITLSYFKGTLQDKRVFLAWETLTEENFDYFEVQRSVHGAAFETIGAVKGNGFTSEPQQYAFTDPSPRIGFNYYRLNAVDYDGTSELFQVISVEVKPDFSSVRIYPNPNNGDSFTLAIPENLQGGIFNLAVTDVNGNVLLEQQVAESTVQASFQSKLAPGIYFVSLETLNYTSTLRLLVN